MSQSTSAVLIVLLLSASLFGVIVDEKADLFSEFSLESGTPSNHESQCIDPQDIVFEFYFSVKFIFANGTNLDDVSNLLPSNSCVFSKINFKDNLIYVAQNNTNRLPASQIFDIETEGTNIFDSLSVTIDAINQRDCLEIDKQTCMHAVVDIYPDRSYDFGDFINSGYSFGPQDHVTIRIKESLNNPRFGELLEIDGIDSCDSGMVNYPHYQFLPHYEDNLTRVLVQCTAWGYKTVYDFSNVSMNDVTSYTVEDIIYGPLANHNTKTDYMWWRIDSRHGFNGEYDSCYVEFMRGGVSEEAELVKRFVYSYEDLEVEQCSDYDVYTMSQSEDYFVLSVDRNRNTDGQYIVNYNSGEEVRISEISYGFKGAWLPNSNSFVFFEREQNMLRMYNAETNQFTDLLSYSELESFLIGTVELTHIDTAEYFGTNSISLLTCDTQSNGGCLWSYSRLDFNSDFTNYEVYQQWNTNSVQGAGCGGSTPPSLRFNDGNPFGSYSLDGCSNDILIGMPEDGEIYGLYINTFNKISIRTNLTSLYMECNLFRFGATSNDFDGDGLPDKCDFDIDEDGVPNWLDDLSGEYFMDADFDGIRDLRDDCPNGYEYWSTERYFSLTPFDNDNDGCHDILEDDDDDNDNVMDSIDDCPLRENGQVDIDMDGLCEGDDLDDDGDNYSDSDEISCGSNLSDFNDLPADNDQDMICDELDEDIDGDNVTNSDDVFPYDRDEWYDLDQDGIGNNSDDCVGTYGTSTIDRLGCLDQDGDGVSDLNDLDPYDAEIGLDEYDGPRLDIVEENETNLSTDQTDMGSESDGVVVFSAIGVFIVAGIIIFVRSRRSSPDDEEESGDADDYYRNVTANTVTSSYESSSQRIPDYSLSGIQDESGYEVLEYPEGSEQWWWKDTENQCWVIWE